MKKILSSLLLGLTFYCISSSAQIGPWTVPYVPRGNTQQQDDALRGVALQEQSRRHYAYLESIAENGRRTGNVSVSTSSNELEKKVRKYVKPDNVLSDRYRDFLKLPNTGLSVLFSQKACEAQSGESFEKLLKRCPFNFLAGGGSYFSFRNSGYMRSVWADIGIKDNWIFSLGLFNQGILVNLGDTPIENLTLTDKGINYLANFVPATSPDEGDKQFKQFENGLVVDGFKYQKVLPIELEKTYALRVVAYKVAYPVAIETEFAGRKTIYPFMYNDRKDVVVVFRIVKKDPDGTLSILWKELVSRAAPEMIIPATGESEKK